MSTFYHSYDREINHINILDVDQRFMELVHYKEEEEDEEEDVGIKVIR